MSRQDPKDPLKHTMESIESVSESQRTEMALPGFVLPPSKAPIPPEEDLDEAALEALQDATNIQINQPLSEDGRTELHEFPSLEEIMSHGRRSPQATVPMDSPFVPMTPPPSQLQPSAASNSSVPSHGSGSGSVYPSQSSASASPSQAYPADGALPSNASYPSNVGAASYKYPTGSEVASPGSDSHSSSHNSQVWELSEGADDSDVMVLGESAGDEGSVIDLADDDSAIIALTDEDEAAESKIESTQVTTNVHRDDFSVAWFQDKPRYQQRGLLAKGGMGFVRRVFDHRILRNTAMKLLKPELASQKPELQRFLSEAQITGQLEHPNIVPVYDVGLDEGGRFFFTMQMVRGRTLRHYLKESHFDPSQEASLFRALQIFLKVCDALAFAHSRGILHRDLKPANIMVGDFGEVYLMDWGIASVLHQKGTETKIQEPIYLSHKKAHQDLDSPGSVIGSVSYIAPEQAHGKLDQLDKRTDIFSLGAILYQILTLTPPYLAKSFPAILLKARACEIEPPQERVPNLHLPRMLCDIAMKAMHKDPDERFQSVHELKERIEAFMHGDDRFPRRQFSAGTVIIREGDEGDMAFGILKGRCLVYKIEDGERVDLREMGPGEVFGEAAVLAAQDRSATVEAIDDVMVTCLSRDALGSAFGNESWMGRLVQTIALRFNDIDRQLSDMRRHNKILLLANRLLVYIHSFGQRIDERTVKAQWSIVSMKLASRTGWLEDELLHHMGRIDGCYIDSHNDILTVDIKRFEHWCDQTNSQP